MLLQQRGTEKLQSYKCGEKVSGEMVEQWMSGNSSDGSKGKMTGWFWQRGCWLFERFRAGWGSFLFRDSMREREGEKDGSVYSNRDILEGLGEIFSGLGIEV